MNVIKPAIFVVPGIAFILISTLYYFLVPKSANRKTFNKFILVMIILAFQTNFIWEIIQIRYYKNPTYDIKHIAFCGLASLADVLMVLLLYFGFATIYNNIFWISPLQFQKIIVMVLLGGAGAILSEMWHLSIGSWAYNNSMPLIPVVNVGISPILQFMVLPLLIYFLSYRRTLKYTIKQGYAQFRT